MDAAAVSAGATLMGWKSKTLDVTLPEDLRDKAGGVCIVTCRRYGGGRQQRVQTRREVRTMERFERMGRAMAAAAEKHAEALQAGRAEKPDPETVLVAQHPPDLVCMAVVRDLDGERIRGEDLLDWVDEAHPDVLRFVALAVYADAELAPETEDEQGEGSGGGSDSSSGKVATMSGQHRRKTRTS